MKKKTTIILIVLICIITIASAFSYWAFIIPENVAPGSPCGGISMRFNQTKKQENYVLTIIWISPNQITTSNLEWWVVNNDTSFSARNKFPTKGGVTGGSFNNNITVVWFDGDNNGKLSKKDTIEIYSPSLDLIGFEFGILEYLREEYDEDGYHLVRKYSLIGQIKFNENQ